MNHVMSMVVGMCGMMLILFGWFSAPGWAEAMFFGYLMYKMGLAIHEEERRETPPEVERDVKP